MLEMLLLVLMMMRASWGLRERDVGIAMGQGVTRLWVLVEVLTRNYKVSCRHIMAAGQWGRLSEFVNVDVSLMGLAIAPL
jgi:hypothetical protein